MYRTLFLIAIIATLIGLFGLSADAQRVWLDWNPAVNTTMYSRVTVRFSGYESFARCKVLFKDPSTEIVLLGAERLGDCTKGFMVFQLPDMLPNYEFYLQSWALVPGLGIYDYEATNSTIYYQTPPAPDELPMDRKRSAEVFVARNEINYYGIEFKPVNASVWLDGEPLELGPDSLVTVDYTGLEPYGDHIVAFLVADNGVENLSVRGYTWEYYAPFKKFSMPSSPTAYFVIAVMDFESGLPVLHFSSDNSVRLIKDSDYDSGIQKRDIAIQQAAEKHKAQGRSLPMEPVRAFDVFERTVGDFNFHKQQEYFSEQGRVKRVRRQYFSHMFGMQKLI